MRLKDKVAIVTGASSGIGREVALKFAEEGAKVAIAARRLERLEEVKKIAEERGYSGEILPVRVDVSKDEDLKNLLDTTLEKFDTVDILVNNTGILDEYQALEHVQDEVWNKVFDVNIHSLMKLCRLVIPIMKEKKAGSIVNTASVGGLHGMRGGLAYVTTKHAVVGLTKNIAYTYADLGIRCNAVAPGIVNTEIAQTVKNPDNVLLDKIVAGSKLSPGVAKPEQLADTYLYLASDDSSFTNGTVIVVDGGWTAY